MLIVAVLAGGYYYLHQKRVRHAEMREAEFQATMHALQNAGTNPLDSVYAEVAEAEVRQYYIAKRKGDLMQICVQAGLVVAGYLQAENETEYRKWKDTERADCSRAGLRQ